MSIIPWKKTAPQKGFTVVELLFSTTIFALVLLTVAAAFIQVSRLYYRGVITSRTQDVARAVTDDVSRTLQFNSGTVAWDVDGEGGVRAFCVGNVRYNVQLDQNITEPSDWALVRDSGASDCTQAVNPEGGVELLGREMRINRFHIQQVGDSRTFSIQVRVIYGDDDLIDDTDPDNPVCRGLRIGGQFCAVSELETVVTRRIQS